MGSKALFSFNDYCSLFMCEDSVGTGSTIVIADVALFKCYAKDYAPFYVCLVCVVKLASFSHRRLVFNLPRRALLAPDGTETTYVNTNFICLRLAEHANENNLIVYSDSC